MPAMLDDPDSPTIYRTSGSGPFPDPHNAQPSLPVDVYPRQVTLRDRVTVATIVPFSSRHQVPTSLLAYLNDQLNKEIEGGDTYPMLDTMPFEKFSSYWFQNFGAVMLLGNIESADDVVEGKDWATECLGSFYIKPNYPGRSSHVCNAGFLVTDAARNRGVGRLMGESYLDWAPKLGYTYSVFNLVYETNVASCRIWDALGFKRIGRVKGAGNLKSYPDQLTDAIIYGRDLGPDGSDIVSEERFDKIAFYLRYGKYPTGADRAEKSRLRSAATHYKLLDSGKLMLKDKEVIADPKQQYEIARATHVLHHGGINKTTATIAEKYHWVRIKETVSLVIRNCTECKELGKASVVRAEGVTTSSRRTIPNPIENILSSHNQNGVSATGRIISLPPTSHPDSELDSVDWKDEHHHPHHHHHHQTSVSPQVLNRTLPETSDHHPPLSMHHPPQSQHQHQQHNPHPHQRNLQNDYMPLDPQIMEDVRQHLGSYNSTSHTHSHHSHDSHLSASSNVHDFAGVDNNEHSGVHRTPSFEHHDELHDGEDAFGAILRDTEEVHGADGEGEEGDLDMLIDQDDDEDDHDHDHAVEEPVKKAIQSMQDSEYTAGTPEDDLSLRKNGHLEVGAPFGKRARYK